MATVDSIVDGNMATTPVGMTEDALRLNRIYQQVQPPYPSNFDKRLFLLDNRILPQQVAFQDKENPYIWIHPNDLSPERDLQCREKLLKDCSVLYPPFHEDKIRGLFVDTIKETVRKDPNLSDIIPPYQQPVELDSSPYDYPLTHLVSGMPPPLVFSEAEARQLSDAVAIYLMIEHVLADRGYPELIAQKMRSLSNYGVARPDGQRLFHELNDALNVSAHDLIHVMASEGVDGVAALLKVDPALKLDIEDLVNTIAPRGFPLNDVINWKVGRMQSDMEGASAAAKMEVGLHVRVDAMIDSLREEMTHYHMPPEQFQNEKLLIAAFDKVPPPLAELFFEEGGIVVFTQEPDLRNLVGIPATGYHVSYHTTANPQESLHHIYISQDLGLPETTATIVHELHHLFYPQQCITHEQAAYADSLLRADEERLHTLKYLADSYQTGDEATKAEVLKAFEGLNPPEMQQHGVSFFDATDRVSMSTFIGAINEAYHFLQMESPTYNRISTYSNPLDRFKEVIPRYAEMRFVKHVDYPEMMAYIAPAITEMYEDIYLPHLEQRLEFLRVNQPSKADALRASLNAVPQPSGFNTPDIPKNLQSWEENLGGIIITHPAGDNRPIGQRGAVSVSNYLQNDVLPEQSLTQAAARQDAAAQPQPKVDGTTAMLDGLAMQPEMIAQLTQK